jgi:flagellar protein FlaG
MTEIGSSGSSAQVITLNNTSVQAPASDTVEREKTKATAPLKSPELFKESDDEQTELLSPYDPLVKAAELLEEFIPEFEQTSDTHLRIDKDEETGRFVYYNVDKESGEVVRQFPPENILKFLSYYRGLEGLILDDTI